MSAKPPRSKFGRVLYECPQCGYREWHAPGSLLNCPNGAFLNHTGDTRLREVRNAKW